MSSSLQITKQLTADNKWEIIAVIIPGGSLPVDIFMYENTGTIEIGAYQGVVDLEQYQRLQRFTGSIITKFGNRYVKFTQAKINLDSNESADQVIAVITKDVKALSIAFQHATSTTNIINIP